MIGSSAAHSALVEQIMIKVGALPFARIWKRHVGLFYIVRKDRQTGKVVYTQPIQIGTEGEPDLEGILRRWDGAGILFGIESKTGKATQTTEQKRYQAMIERMGGLYILARDADDALDQINAAREKKKETGPLPDLLETTHKQTVPEAGSGADVR